MSQDAAGSGLSPDQLAEIEVLDTLIARLDEIRTQAGKNPEYAADQPWPVFIRRMRLLTPQAYGIRIQNRLAKFFDWLVVSASLDRGDIRDQQGSYWEVKVSLPTRTSPRVNFVQLRPHQDISGYHLFVIEPDNTVVHLRLSKRQMLAEIKKLGNNLAHGTKNAVAQNATTEYAIRFSWSERSEMRKEWIRKYGQPAVVPT